MNKRRNYLPITKPILIFCIILILFVMVSCGKNQEDKTALNVNKINSKDKIFVDEPRESVKEILSDENYEKEVEKILKTNEKDSENKNSQFGFSDIKNTYYGKYNLNNEDVFGNFEITRNSIIFTPDDGNSKEIIHFSGMKNIERVEHPSGKIDLILQYDGYEREIKNVSNEMFSDVLLYTAK